MTKKAVNQVLMARHENILMLRFECTSNELAEETAKLWAEMLAKADPDAKLIILGQSNRD